LKRHPTPKKWEQHLKLSSNTVKEGVHGKIRGVEDNMEGKVKYQQSGVVGQHHKFRYEGAEVDTTYDKEDKELNIDWFFNHGKSGNGNKLLCYAIEYLQREGYVFEEVTLVADAKMAKHVIRMQSKSEKMGVAEAQESLVKYYKERYGFREMEGSNNTFWVPEAHLREKCEITDVVPKTHEFIFKEEKGILGGKQYKFQYDKSYIVWEVIRDDTMLDFTSLNFNRDKREEGQKLFCHSVKEMKDKFPTLEKVSVTMDPLNSPWVILDISRYNQENNAKEVEQLKNFYEGFGLVVEGDYADGAIEDVCKSAEGGTRKHKLFKRYNGKRRRTYRAFTRRR